MTETTEKRIKASEIEPERLRLEWISASEGDKFAAVVRDMTEQIKKLGPSPVRMPEVKA